MILAIDSLGWLGGLLAWLVLAAGIIAFFRGATRNERERAAERAEIDGSWEAFRLECIERRTRAEQRHGRRAA